MADIIPPFFTKRDFWAMLLPGYTMVTIGVFLFFPTLIIRVEGIYMDLFTIVIFIVAGPVAGFILLQFYYHISAYYPTHIREKGWRKKFEFRRKYEELKLKCTEDDRRELEELEGRHYFGKCTGIALTLVGLYGIAFFRLPYSQSGELPCTSIPSKESILCSERFEIRIAVLFIIFGLAAILYFGAFYEYRRVHLPLICALMNKYSLQWTEICEKTKRDEYENLIDETFRRFSSHTKERKKALQDIQSELKLERKIFRISPTFYAELTEKISKKIKDLYEESIDETFSRCYSNSVECKNALHDIQSEIKSEYDLGMISQVFYNQLKAKISNKEDELG